MSVGSSYVVGRSANALWKRYCAIFICPDDDSVSDDCLRIPLLLSWIRKDFRLQPAVNKTNVVGSDLMCSMLCEQRSVRRFPPPSCPLMAMEELMLSSMLCEKGLIDDFHHQAALWCQGGELMVWVVAQCTCSVKKVYCLTYLSKWGERERINCAGISQLVSWIQAIIVKYTASRQ